MTSAAMTSWAGTPGTTSAGGFCVMDEVGPSLVYILAPRRARWGRDFERTCRHGWRRDMVNEECKEAVVLHPQSSQSASWFCLIDLVIGSLRQIEPLWMSRKHADGGVHFIREVGGKADTGQYLSPSLPSSMLQPTVSEWPISRTGHSQRTTR
jgi:hypothetical protein